MEKPMPVKMWNPQDCVKCPLFPAACPYMGAQLRDFLCVAVTKIGDEAAARTLEAQRKERCEGDCEECNLPDWMKNC
jgi:hypothetical protein